MPPSFSLLPLVVVGTLTWEPAAGKQPAKPLGHTARVEIAWDAPFATCPSQREIETAVESRLHGVPDWQPRIAQLSVAARVRGGGDDWQLSLEISDRGQAGRREVAARSCQELADATSLLVAMTIDPRALTAAPNTVSNEVGSGRPGDRPAPPEAGDRTSVPPAPKQQVVSEPACKGDCRDPDVKVATPDAADEEVPFEPRPQVELEVAAGVGTAGLPRVGMGVLAGAALVGNRYRVELRGGYWFPRTQPLDGLAGASVSLRAATISLRGCARLIHRTVEFPLCAGLRSGALRGESSGLARNASHTSVLAGLELSPAVDWVPRPWLFVRLRTDFGLLFTRPRLTVRNYGVAYRPPPVTAELLLSFGVRF